MILDLEAQTVTFEGYTKLSKAQIWSIIELLDPDIEDDIGVLTKLNPEFGRHNIDVLKTWRVESDRRDCIYCVVHFEDGSWACSCPDWTHRRVKDDTYCKHISRVMHPRGWMV